MIEENGNFSFDAPGKESFKARLLSLIGTRSVRAAAKDWGVPVSTLNNYIHKGTEPSFKMACLISNKEHVSLNWLAFGSDENTPRTPCCSTVDAGNLDNANQTITAILSSLSTDEQLELARLLGRKGADFLTILLDDNIQELHALSGFRRELALRLKDMSDSEAREIYEECEAKVNHLNVTQKKASA
ncbi:helix-turn-helix domain containing protein [Escherichia coli]|uniref:helix-turn-helix domain containing protein n=1 Tax=Escherichia coli TaxID=562 RepID=UPI001F246D45|nr:helix-turn-helix domain containing protein [Escherichia coli]MCF4020324.1 helix-turn-helix domain containing protein [Escherichia coli]MCF4055034.1 helix-turn-helix domain containing protein [Escherichia coli]MED7543197.1 helix-turn-helix domain containing protein [Escherichia coli O157]